MTELEEWKQAASVEAGLRREFLTRALVAEAQLADAVKLLHDLLGLVPGSGEAAYDFVERYLAFVEYGRMEKFNKSKG